MTEGIILGISGPVVTVRSNAPVRMFEIAYVGNAHLLGEVIRIRRDQVDIQVYEDTNGVRSGEGCAFTGELLAVDLGPGILGSVLDGIGRPLKKLGEDGIFIRRGIHTGLLSHVQEMPFVPSVRVGDALRPGSFIGCSREGSHVEHRIMVPPFSRGGIVEYIAPEGRYALDRTICRVSDGEEYALSQKWRVRVPRPVQERLPLDRPLITGQRVLDTLFPLALGGAAVLPGGFGTGKTVTQQSLAKWCDADIIVYIGCGERGNEMTEVLEEFPELSDPWHDAPLMERLVLIANTSNMPVAAREASIYLGMTIAEYYRDMGYNVAIMADSTSRWAEALREIGGRLEEMPGEEGYPAYLGSRLAQYYERAGRVRALGEPDRSGSVTVINAVSPAGGDFSEPVTQASLRLSGAFWGLDKRLAQQRHFPAINWSQSFSLYEEILDPVFSKEIGPRRDELKQYLRAMLDNDRRLVELVQLVGRDGLSEEDKWILLMAELIRIVYLQQNAFSDADASCSTRKQFEMLDILKRLDDVVRKRIFDGVVFEEIAEIPFLGDLLRIREFSETDFGAEASRWLNDQMNRVSGLAVMPK